MTDKSYPDWWNPNPKCYWVCNCNVSFDDPDRLQEHMLTEHSYD